MLSIFALALTTTVSAYVPAAAPLHIARRSPAPAMLAHGSRVNALQMLLAQEPEKPKKKVQTAEPQWKAGAFKDAYKTDKPSEDPDETCFMTPTWMEETGEEKKEWVCTSEPVRPDDAEDGF